MRVQLKNIAVVQMGYSFRARMEQMEAGEIAVIQMKDLTDQNRVDCDGLMRIDMEKLGDHHLVQPGDLVFRSRGMVTTSAILTEDPGTAVVSAPLLRIRANNKAVLPEYLNWFINQRPAQAFLASHAKGTVQQMISKSALESLEVFVPSINRQKAIAELTALGESEQNLMKKLAEKRRQYLSTMLMQLAQGE